MSSPEVNIPITATDLGATDTINNVKGSLDDLNSSAFDASGGVNDLAGNITGMGDAAGSGGASATDSFNEFTDTLESSTRIGATALVGLDRIQISMDAVNNATTRVTIAQENYNAAVERHGPSSDQAINAQQQLQIAEQSLEIAHEREQVRMIFGSLVIIPQMIAALRDLGESLDLASLKEDLFTGEIDANTAAQLANLAVATLGVAVPIALFAMTAAEASAPQGPQAMNVFGDVNVAAPPGGSTAQFAQSVQSTAAQSARG